MSKLRFITLFAALATGTAQAASMTVTMNATDSKGVGKSLGTITMSATRHGTVFTPSLTGLTPGIHGFHIHTNPNCGPAEKAGKVVPGLGAGGHYDPKNAGSHGSPWGAGHLGDLPVLYVTSDGKATTPVLAPRVKFADVKGRALMIHAGGDNYSDKPKKLGGGGARMACGVVQ